EEVKEAITWCNDVINFIKSQITILKQLNKNKVYRWCDFDGHYTRGSLDYKLKIGYQKIETMTQLRTTLEKVIKTPGKVGSKEYNKLSESGFSIVTDLIQNVDDPDDEVIVCGKFFL